MIIVARLSFGKGNIMRNDALNIVSSCRIILVNCTDGSLVLMMRAISTFGVFNRILVAGTNHVRKGLVTVVGRTLHIIPERDGVSSAFTIVHPEIVGTCADVLTMENAVVGHMVLVMAIGHIAMRQCLCIPSVRRSMSIPTRSLFRPQSSFGFSLLLYSLCICFMPALGEIRLGCFRLLGQAETFVAAFLAIATGNVLCALLRCYFGVFRPARLVVVVAGR